MELIKQLNEDARTQMDEETFSRLVQFAKEDIESQLGPDASDGDMLEVIHGMIEDVPGFEETDAAVDLANKVLAAIKHQL